MTASAKRIADAVTVQSEADIPTLEVILVEYETETSGKRKIWQRTKNGNACEAARRIKAVLGGHLPHRITDITLDGVACSLESHRPPSGKEKANGQVSKARSYLKRRRLPSSYSSQGLQPVNENDPAAERYYLLPSTEPEPDI